jgi:hypothetical protein
MDRITQASKTAKVIEPIVMKLRLLFRQIFRQANIKYMD